MGGRGGGTGRGEVGGGRWEDWFPLGERGGMSGVVNMQLIREKLFSAASLLFWEARGLDR